MREIKFRGRCVNGGWAYGFLCHDASRRSELYSDWFISNRVGKPYACPIDPSTIGQYTGLKDKNGVEIYEGDVIESSCYKHVVIYDDDNARFAAVNVRHLNIEMWGCALTKEWIEDFGKEVVGNIHDNPELTKYRYAKDNV